MGETFLKYCIIIVSFLAMFAMRYLPFKLLGERGTSEEFERFIKYIPLGAFTALTVKDVFFKNGNLFLSLDNIKIIPLILVIFISIRFKNIGISVVSGGIIIYIAMNYL